MTTTDLKSAVFQQRESLAVLFAQPMSDLAAACAKVMGERVAVEGLLNAALHALGSCKHLFALDANGVQFVDNITRKGPNPTHFGRNRLNRPYMKGLGDCDFSLSEAYFSRNAKRPMLTAVQVVRGPDGACLGYVGADFDLRELPGTKGIYTENHAWRQIKGDPAIREGLFAQERSSSPMDERMDDVLPLMAELMVEHGVFHGKLHFSSSRATIWLTDDPYTYRILNFDELVDPNICLAYPRRPYFERAIVPMADIPAVFEMFRALRFADENIYLRAGSLNVVNGMVAMNFSCDGSHYLRYDEFLTNGLEFWFGKLG